MKTYILEEHHVPGKTVLAQKILGSERTANTWKPYQVKIIETHDFKSEAACMAYFRQQKGESCHGEA